jgi:hypothetical protein
MEVHERSIQVLGPAPNTDSSCDEDYEFRKRIEIVSKNGLLIKNQPNSSFSATKRPSEFSTPVENRKKRNLSSIEVDKEVLDSDLSSEESKQSQSTPRNFGLKLRSKLVPKRAKSYNKPEESAYQLLAKYYMLNVISIQIPDKFSRPVQMRHIQDVLNCKVCSNLMKTPMHCIECGCDCKIHTGCLECLLTVSKSDPQSKCPVCKARGKLM